MIITVQPEQEKVIAEAIESGVIRSPEDAVDVAVAELRARMGNDFFKKHTIEELAAAQGVKPFNPAHLPGPFLSDEEVEDFVAEIYRVRRRGYE